MRGTVQGTTTPEQLLEKYQQLKFLLLFDAPTPTSDLRGVLAGYDDTASVLLSSGRKWHVMTSCRDGWNLTDSFTSLADASIAYQRMVELFPADRFSVVTVEDGVMHFDYDSHPAKSGE